MKQCFSIDFKIKSAQSLKLALKRLRAKKKSFRVVFTNGCFDLLHKGHVRYLEKARQLGDVLVVALNSDASVKRLKGPERPLNTLQDRLEVMAALTFVDFVTDFDQDTPLELIDSLRPQILVKGGDWQVEHIVGFKEVMGWGGKVYSIDYIKGRSTTQLISKVKGLGDETAPKSSRSKKIKG